MAFCCPSRGFGRWCTSLSAGIATGFSSAYLGVANTIAALSDAYQTMTAPENRTASATAAVSTTFAAAAAISGKSLPDNNLTELIAGAATGLAVPLLLSTCTPGNKRRAISLAVISTLIGMLANIDAAEGIVASTSIALLTNVLLERIFWTLNNPNAHWSTKTFSPRPALEFLDLTSKTLFSMAAFIIAFFLNDDLISSPQVFWGIGLSIMATTFCLSIGQLISEMSLGEDAKISKWLKYGSSTIPGFLMMFGTLFEGLNAISDNVESQTLLLTLAALFAITRLSSPDETLETIVTFKELLTKTNTIDIKPEGREKLKVMGKENSTKHPTQHSLCTPSQLACLNKLTFPLKWLFSFAESAVQASQSIPLGLIMLIAAIAPQPENETDESNASAAIAPPLLGLGLLNAIYKGLQLKYFLEKKGHCARASVRTLKWLHILTESAANWGILVLGLLAPPAGMLAISRDQPVGVLIANGERVVPDFIIGLSLSAPLMLSVLIAIWGVRNTEYGADTTEKNQLKLCKKTARSAANRVTEASSRALKRMGSSGILFALSRSDSPPEDAKNQASSGPGIQMGTALTTAPSTSATPPRRLSFAALATAVAVTRKDRVTKIIGNKTSKRIPTPLGAFTNTSINPLTTTIVTSSMTTTPEVTP